MYGNLEEEVPERRVQKYPSAVKSRYVFFLFFQFSAVKCWCNKITLSYCFFMWQTSDGRFSQDLFYLRWVRLPGQGHCIRLLVKENIFPLRFTGTVGFHECPDKVPVAVQGIVPYTFYDLIIAFSAIVGSAMLPSP